MLPVMVTLDLQFRYDSDSRRFEGRLPDVDGVAFIDVVISRSVWTLVHTEVPASLGGRGVASALVKAALAHVRDAGLKVRPVCPFVVGYLERHPEELDVVHERFRGRFEAGSAT
jgi:uncharacterized protein